MAAGLQCLALQNVNTFYTKQKKHKVLFFWRGTCTHTFVCRACVTSSSPCCLFQVCIYEPPGSTENQIFFNIYLNVTLTAVSVSMYSCASVCVCTRCQKCHVTSPQPPCMCERTNKVNQSQTHLFPHQLRLPWWTCFGLWTCTSLSVFALSRADTITFTSHLILNLTPNRTTSLSLNKTL